MVILSILEDFCDYGIHPTFFYFYFSCSSKAFLLWEFQQRQPPTCVCSVFQTLGLSFPLCTDLSLSPFCTERMLDQAFKVPCKFKLLISPQKHFLQPPLKVECFDNRPAPSSLVERDLHANPLSVQESLKLTRHMTLISDS